MLEALSDVPAMAITSLCPVELADYQGREVLLLRPVISDAVAR